MKKAVIALAASAALIAGPASAEIFTYDLGSESPEGVTQIMVDNELGKVKFLDANGDLKGFGMGEAFKSWEGNQLSQGIDFFKFESGVGTFNGLPIEVGKFIPDPSSNGDGSLIFNSQGQNLDFNASFVPAAPPSDPVAPVANDPVAPAANDPVAPASTSTSSGGSGSSTSTTSSSSSSSSSGGAPGDSSGGSSGGADVPAPGVLGLMALALAAIGLGRRRRKVSA